MNHLDITIRRTWCGKTRARLVGRVGHQTVLVEVTGWRRTHVLAEAQQTFAAASTDPTYPLQKGLP